MELTEEIIEKVVKKALKAERDEFWVPQPQHFLDHQMFSGCRKDQGEWRKNHEFVSSVRSGSALGKKAGIATIVVSTLSFFGYALWLAIKESLDK